jgi:hypothetical protein
MPMSSKIHPVEIPVSIAEVIDKITILEIKVQQFTDPEKTKNAKIELDLLHERRDQWLPQSAALDALAMKLKAVNQRMWDMEHAIRDYERRKDFGADFVAVARAIYLANDERAILKRQINIAFGSRIIEEKSYIPVHPDGTEEPGRSHA